MTIRTPMKPGTLKHLSDVPDWAYPLHASYKYDGIRCCKQHGQALSYQLKPIANKHVRSLIERKCKDGWDGELIDGSFNKTQSSITTHEGKPDFRFVVFDVMPQGSKDSGYSIRRYPTSILPYFVDIAPVFIINNYKELVAFEKKAVKLGYEGIILRTANSPYKYGRSTLRQFWMVKYKRFADAEGIVIGFEERISIHGVPLNTLGSLVLKTKWGKVKVSGFKAKQAKEIWTHKKQYLRKIWTFKYQKHGTIDKPRFGTSKGERRDV